MSKKKIILAYSGGLDTTCAIPWLKENGYDEVICFSANLGSEFSPEDLIERGKATGASRVYVMDLRKELANEYLIRGLKANAVYENKYLLATAYGRPLIAKYLVDIAHKEGVGTVGHGCSAKGNDQVRLDLGVKMLDPKLKIVAPLRYWELSSRESEIDYAMRKKLPIKLSKEKIYSIDQNIWGIAIECGALEDLRNEAPQDSYMITRKIEETPDKPEYVEIEFDRGVPVALNGEKLSFLEILEKLNRIAGTHGVGRTDMVEDRIVGIKSREIYEAPAAWTLIFAHKELEAAVLDRETLAFKEIVSQKYAQLVYQGLWFTRLRQSLDAFVEKTQERVCGTIKVRLFKGNISVASRDTQYSLYKMNLATYGDHDEFVRENAEAFIDLYAMPFLEK
ncbi:MAG: argininosuccinate synthase [Candidatus Marinimicrobia bacterium]|nr:argininosuccinate synthase [Candidatus Neomarinimicrobiota bacterium]